MGIKKLSTKVFISLTLKRSNTSVLINNFTSTMSKAAERCYHWRHDQKIDIVQGPDNQRLQKKVAVVVLPNFKIFGEIFFNVVFFVETSFLTTFYGLYFIIYSWLLRCSTARGSSSGLSLRGPTKVKAPKCFLFTEGSLIVENNKLLSYSQLIFSPLLGFELQTAPV